MRVEVIAPGDVPARPGHADLIVDAAFGTVTPRSHALSVRNPRKRMPATPMSVKSGLGLPLAALRSRNVARSGTMPMNQKRTDVVRYVDTAKTSHMSGLRNCGQSPIVFGYGNSQ